MTHDSFVLNFFAADGLLLLLLLAGCTAPAAASPAAGDAGAASCRKCLLWFRAVAYPDPVIRSRVFLNLYVAWFSLRYFV